MKQAILAFIVLFSLQANAGPGPRWVSGVVDGMDHDSVTLLTDKKTKLKVDRKFFNKNTKIIMGKKVKVFVYKEE